MADARPPAAPALRILAPLLVALALAVTTLAGPALAQVKFEDLEGIFDVEPPDPSSDGGALDPSADRPPASGIPSSQATIDAYHASRERLYRYHVEALDHRMTVFRWQYRSSIAIFAVVVLIVLIGLYFSWMQFHASDRGRDLAPSALEASGTGFKVSSPVLGVVILALSLGFFYLYLVHVYPIFEVF